MKYIIKADGVAINKSFDSISDAFGFGRELNTSFKIFESDGGITSPVPVIENTMDTHEAIKSGILFG